MIALSLRSLLAWVLAFVLAVLLSACATPARPLASEAGGALWQGRIAIKVLGDKPDAFSGDFELQGQASQGQLILSTPLGTTVARMEWTPTAARLQSGGRETTSASLNELALRATGVELPLTQLFDWLAGRPTAAPGWEVDLSGHADGRISARRQAPLPPVELRVLLSR